eukprot:1418562-Alexandrium_andersonii.AAC.1
MRRAHFMRSARTHRILHHGAGVTAADEMCSGRANQQNVRERVRVRVCLQARAHARGRARAR